MGMPERYYEEVREGSMIPEGQPISARTLIGVGPRLCGPLRVSFRGTWVTSENSIQREVPRIALTRRSVSSESPVRGAPLFGHHPERRGSVAQSVLYLGYCTEVRYRLRRRCWYLRHTMGAPIINRRFSSVFTKRTTPS